MATQAEKLAALKKAQNPFGEVLDRIQILKGDTGETGPMGPQGPKGDLGAPGRNGRDGIDGKDGAAGAQGPAGRDGLDGKDGKNGKNGVNPAPLEPQTIIDAVLLELKSGLLQPEHINGLGENIKSLQELIKFLKAGGFRGGGSATGGSILAGTQEKSTTVPNGVLTTFAFAHTPGVIIWNGAVQTLTDDYTVSGLTITFTVSAGIPQTGDKVINIYA